jgi:hypothetical protein
VSSVDFDIPPIKSAINTIKSATFSKAGCNESPILFFIAVKEEEDRICVEFIYGEPFSGLGYFREFRLFYRKQKNKNLVFYTNLLREHKFNALFNLIKKRDKNAKISLDNDRIFVLWYDDNGLQT